jgi:ribonuclease-3
MAKGLPITDFKSALQEVAHTASRPQPTYVLVAEQGPEHNKTFTVEARIHSPRHEVEHVSRGQGSTKKMAEQDAARQAIEYLWAREAADGKILRSK